MKKDAELIARYVTLLCLYREVLELWVEELLFGYFDIRDYFECPDSRLIDWSYLLQSLRTMLLGLGFSVEEVDDAVKHVEQIQHVYIQYLTRIKVLTRSILRMLKSINDTKRFLTTFLNQEPKSFDPMNYESWL